MSIQVRKYELGKDYPEICEWWRKRKWRAIPTDDLPQNGLVAEDAEHKYAAIWFYVCEGKWMWIDWLVTNPNAPLRGKPKALELIVDEALKVIRATKISFGESEAKVVTCLNNENLIELFKKKGFIAGDSNMTTMVWGSR